MNFNVRNIGGKYQEMIVDESNTGTLDKRESIALAEKMIIASQELLHWSGMPVSSDACGLIQEDLNKYLESQ
jgi:hypothetical protein